MNMKILFITSSPLHKMHIIDMYINEISEKYETEIWDLSPIFHNKGKSEFTNILKINTLLELNELLDKENNIDQLVVITNILIYDLHVVYNIFHRRHIPIISIDKESMIFWMKDNYEKKHPELLSMAEKRRIKSKSIPVLRKIYSYLEYQHVKFDYILGAYNYFPDACQKFYQIHSLKYDEYIKTKEKKNILQGKYILFMDAGLAHLPSHEGKKNAIDKQEYLNVMNSFFARIEGQFSLPVVIASHPKSGYKEDDFNGRQIILYKTSELLKYAELVLAHYSTSLIELVLQKKKVIFLYSKDYMNSDSRTVLENASEYADMLNALFLDVKEEQEIEIKYDEEAYERFTNKFLICESKKDKRNAGLILEFLGELEKKRIFRRNG